MRFTQQGLGIDRPGNHMEYSTVLSAEIGSDVPPLLLLSDDTKRTDLLEGADKMFVEILADFGIRQCVHTERFSVISRKVWFFEQAGHMQHKHQFFKFDCELGGFRR